METKKVKKSLHIYQIEFKIFKKLLSEDVYIVAYSDKQAKKFFYDWWKKNHTEYAIITLLFQCSNEREKIILSFNGYPDIKERFKIQQDYIYRREKENDSI